MVPSIKASCSGPEAAQHPQTITSMLDCWYKVLILECSVWLSPGIMGPMLVVETIYEDNVAGKQVLIDKNVNATYLKYKKDQVVLRCKTNP